MVLDPSPCLRKALTSHLSARQHLKPASKCAEEDFGQLMETAGCQQGHLQPAQHPSNGLKNRCIPTKREKPPVGLKVADEPREMKVRGQEVLGAVILPPPSQACAALLFYCPASLLPSHPLQFCFPAPAQLQTGISQVQFAS